MSDGLLDDIADPSPGPEDIVVDAMTACSCGRTRTLTSDDLLICPACDQRPAYDGPVVPHAIAAA